MRIAAWIAIAATLSSLPTGANDDTERFVRGMTARFTGSTAVHARLLSEPLPDLDQGHAVRWLQLGPPLDMWALTPDGSRLAVAGATLLGPDGETIAPAKSGHWRADRPPLGVLRLSVPAIGRPWRLWSAFHPVMVRLDEPVGLAVGEEPAALFVRCRAGEALALTLEGEVQATLHNADGSELASAAREERMTLRGVPSAGHVRLELSGPGEVLVRAEEGARWAAFAPWNLFAPSMPRVEIEGNTAPAPGEPLKLRAVTSDPDDDVERISWLLPGDRSVEGSDLRVSVVELADFDVTVRVRDAAGNTATDSVHISPPAPHEARAPGMLIVQAEDFDAEDGGTVYVTDRGHNVGQMITKWHQDIGHALTWRLTVAEAGRHFLYARYATGGSETRRRVEIDGDVPADAYDAVAFEHTGGYGRSDEQWRTMRLGPPVELAAGEHSLTMTNLGDGLALDYLALLPVH